MPKTSITKFEPPSATSLPPASNLLQRPLTRSIYWSAGTTSGPKLSSRAFVMPRHANIVASATALAASGISLVVDLVDAALCLALDLGSSALSSASTWAFSSSSSVCAVEKPAVPSPNVNGLAVPGVHAVTNALDNRTVASATTLLESTMAYAMSIMASTVAYARVAALASATTSESQVDAARSTAVALHISALSSLVSALSSASTLTSSALATATTLDDATLSLNSAAAILSSALSAAAALVPSASATSPGTAPVAPVEVDKAPQAPVASIQSTISASTSAASLLTWAVASASTFVNPLLAEVTSAIGWIRRRSLAALVPAPSSTRTLIPSDPVPS
ncbi:hypothetical protein GSI_08383 [Ganoderma sinense ZZ0214-1]|uniref:Uncharacterized protein n=1 Tax=Ganoderma sinense ZZ0214-1 TaxID=1077348 RepID=A0A2G8S6Q3_9APHY|nr:hypothetical protein GSI_08383 [Ganoderma sinense ZZ0214-1]